MVWTCWTKAVSNNNYNNRQQQSMVLCTLSRDTCTDGYRFNSIGCTYKTWRSLCMFPDCKSAHSGFQMHVVGLTLRTWRSWTSRRAVLRSRWSTGGCSSGTVRSVVTSEWPRSEQPRGGFPSIQMDHRCRSTSWYGTHTYTSFWRSFSG